MSKPSYKKYLKGLVRGDKWELLSALYSFELLWITLPSGRKSIDWRCVPKSLYSVLQAKSDGTWPDNIVIPKSEPTCEIDEERAKKAVVRLYEPKVKGFDVRQIEHFGDAIVNLAARTISAKEIGRPAYFLSAQNLSNNKNLASAGFVSGDAAEIVIGVSYVENGIEKALLDAIDLLKKTEHYKAYYRSK